MYDLAFKGLIESIAMEHMVYLEGVGQPESTCPQVWKDFWKILGPQIRMDDVDHILALSQMKVKEQEIQYRAAVALKKPLAVIPSDFQSESFESKKLVRWELKGSYEHLPEAYEKIFASKIGEQGLTPRQDFCLETYVNSPENTHPDDLITHIDIPVL